MFKFKYFQINGSMQLNPHMTKQLGRRTTAYFENSKTTLILGSSHINRVPAIKHMSKIAISGGKLHHFQKYINLNKDLIRKFQRLVIFDAGKGISIANNKEDILLEYGRLIDNIHQQFPSLIMFSTDQLPRKSTAFTKNAQIISNQILKRNSKHFHLKLFKNFTYRAPRPQRIRQFRKNLFQVDGVHLNQMGQQKLTSILEKVNFQQLNDFKI